MHNSTNQAVKRLTVDLAADDHRQLKRVAVERDTTMSELVIGLLRREGYIAPNDQSLAKGTTPTV
jgi:hypothetical protein